MSLAQRRLWFLHRIHEPTPVYNVPLALRLSGKLDREALETALQDVLSRHEALRTVFPEADGQPYLEIVDGHVARLALSVAEVGEARLTEALTQAARRVFDISQDLPVRAWLFTISPDEHVLLIVMHHIAIDSWSLAPLSLDLGLAYTARRAGLEPGWVPLPVRYSDYTLRQLEMLRGAGNRDSLISEQLAYWKSALAGLPTELPLPADRARPTASSHLGASVTIELNAELHARLLDLAGESRATLFMVLQAGLAALLTRLGAGTDIPVGSPIAGRTDNAAKVVGFLANTLVLRADTSGDPGFRELVDRVRAIDLEAYTHQEVPFEYLVEVLSPARSMARHPLFQVMLRLSDSASDMPCFAGLKAKPVLVDLDATEFDLSWSLTARRRADRVPAGLSGALRYSADLFSRETAEMMAARLARLLTAAVTEPDLPIGQLAVLSAQERSRLIGTGTGRVAEIRPAGVAELFAAQAARTPDAVALVIGDSALTYRALAARACQLARYLRQRGVGPDQLVGLFVERGVEMVVGMLGILAAGGAYVPVDPGYPAERVVFMLEDSRVTLVLTQDRLRDRIPGGDQEMIILDADWDVIAHEPPDAPLSSAHPASVAYVSYTSGSTGTPKGVATTHRNVVNLISDRCWSNGNHERVLFHSPYSFDAATYELWLPLLCGGQVVMTTDNRAGASDLEHVVLGADVTAAYFTTALFEVMSQQAESGLGHLREIWTGGDVLSAIALQQVLDACAGTTVMHAYGPTETTVFCSFQPFGPLRRRVGTLTLGGPMDNTRMYVLDEKLRLALPGVVGQLYVAGAGLARGYLGRGGLTATRFVADPFGEPGTRMYWTGDLARWNAAGAVEFAGRADDQVKVRGFRVEPGEVEAVLARHPLVAQVAVVAREDRPGDKRLACYVVPTAEGGVASSALRPFAREHLPEYLIPSVFVMVDHLPLTPNGKLDRRALPAPSMAAVEAGQTYTAPRTRAEKAVARVWSELLDAERVGIHDNFFALGGDSFLAVRLAARLRALFRVEIPVLAIFRSQTIADLAGELRTAVAASIRTDRTAPRP